MAGSVGREAARELAGQAMSHVGRVPNMEPLSVLRWLTRGRLGRQRGRPAVPRLGTPWQDTASSERTGWRERAGYLGGEQVFAVDYQVCRRCGPGWVEQPHTVEDYQRCGLAAAGLAALRAEYHGLEWHTLGGHFRESEPFWDAVGAGVPGATASGACARTGASGSDSIRRPRTSRLPGAEGGCEFVPPDAG